MGGGGMSIGGHARSGFAPDPYGGGGGGGGSGRAPAPPMSTISSHSWAPEANFLAPRRTSHPALVPSMAESTIAPRGVSQQRGQAIDPRHQLDIPPPHSGHSGHGHHSEHHAHRHSHHHGAGGGHRSHRHEADGDDWDTESDASYYARPKPSRAKSSSSTLSDITPSTSMTVRPSLPHHNSHHRGSPGQHDHSPISPSPLTRDGPRAHSQSHNNQAPSPLSPRAHSSVRHTRKISGLVSEGGAPPPLPSPYRKVTPLAPPESDYSAQEPRALREASERGNRRNSISHGSIDDHARVHGHRRLASPQGYASDDEGRYSSRSRSRHRHRQEDGGGISVYSSSSRRQRKHLAEAYPEENHYGRRN